MIRKNKEEKSKRPFSKTLLIQESVLIWIITLSFIFLAYICIVKNFTGSLPWLAAMVSFPWASYGVSQVYYYKKALAENTKDGIKYVSAISEIENASKMYNSINVLNNINNNNMNDNTNYELDIYGPI